MSQINEERIISHKIKEIISKVENLDTYSNLRENHKARKNQEKIIIELEKLFANYMEFKNDNFLIKKKMTISNKARSKSFAKWVFNNREL